MIYFDTETCGFKGPAVTIQYAEDEGPIIQWDIWKHPIQETIDLIEWMMGKAICGFNLAFDQFHLCKIYTMFLAYPDKSAIPQNVISDLANYEILAQEGPCLKPKAACDIMLHARKGPYQSTMDRKPIRVKRVPTVLAKALAKKLEEVIPLPGIYFARRKRKNIPQWQIRDITDLDGEINPNFKDLELKFEPSTALKALAVDALGISEDDILRIGDQIGVDPEWRPKEDEYVPYGGNWPEVIKHHINYWAFNPLAKKYAGDDVEYTRGLYHYFGDPEPGDTDSELACMVGAVRWKGFKINVEQLSKLRDQAAKLVEEIPTAPRPARKFVEQHMNTTERLVIRNSTKKVVLQEITKWIKEDGTNHPAAVAAQQVLNAREAQKEIELYDKLIRAGKFYAGFKVIGTKSTRMSGSDGLNPQGIKKDKKVRACFQLAPDGFDLSGGDFDAFEVSLMEAEWKDPELRKQLMAGKKIHALFAMELYPGSTYEEIMEEDDRGEFLNQYVNGTRYKDGKQGVFGMGYGGTEYTLESKLGIPHDIAVQAFKSFGKRFPGVHRARQKVFDAFCSMRQPDGIGTAVEWHEPQEYIESMFGFRRYFTLENKICRALYDLAQDPPKEWREYKIKVMRRERQQTASGALQSALYGAAFAIQSANMRAAGNHVIQSPGATITKELQRRLWDLQPIGVSDWRVMPLNVHDEIMCPMVPDLANHSTKLVEAFVEEYKKYVPLLSITWKVSIKSWGEK